ncbi:hypothetical protein NC661_20355 [Aquibacillus koreensis]|uniref:Lipoprotein n=1 Tax=Aquibacillus koreensis TaxID=279446 RepID=A0A9X4AKC6_9BACI|nr:hypothetical protein [Aquibacillus koreensis]MCT2535478.1 hypothetical protein [Aquibacillus koreensis]MDC3422709.1 hypothetical protein [Aquibacillus koreensis]
MNLTKTILILLLVFIVIGCSEEKTQDIAEKYLAEQGYEVITTIESPAVSSFTLVEEDVSDEKKPMLAGTIVKRMWLVQEQELKDYKGEKIEVKQFVVENHPLDDWVSEYDETLKSVGETHVTLLVVDGDVIGGTSAPGLNRSVAGNPQFSLDGKTFEEVHPGKSYTVWSDDWIETYLDYIKYE